MLRRVSALLLVRLYWSAPTLPVKVKRSKQPQPGAVAGARYGALGADVINVTANKL